MPSYKPNKAKPKGYFSIDWEMTSVLNDREYYETAHIDTWRGQLILNNSDVVDDEDEDKDKVVGDIELYKIAGEELGYSNWLSAFDAHS